MGGTEYTPPKVQKWKELRWVLLLVGGSSRRSVGGFRNESVVFNEGAGDYSFRPLDSELDECKRKPQNGEHA